MVTQTYRRGEDGGEGEKGRMGDRLFQLLLNDKAGLTYI